MQVCCRTKRGKRIFSTIESDPLREMVTFPAAGFCMIGAG